MQAKHSQKASNENTYCEFYIVGFCTVSFHIIRIYTVSPYTVQSDSVQSELLSYSLSASVKFIVRRPASSASSTRSPNVCRHRGSRKAGLPGSLQLSNSAAPDVRTHICLSLTGNLCKSKTKRFRHDFEFEVGVSLK